MWWLCPVVCFSEGFEVAVAAITLSLPLSPCLSAAHWKGHPDTADTQSGQPLDWAQSSVPPYHLTTSRAPACPHSTLNLSHPPHSPLSSACKSLAQFYPSSGLKLSVDPRQISGLGWMAVKCQPWSSAHVTFWCYFLHNNALLAWHWQTNLPLMRSQTIIMYQHQLQAGRATRVAKVYLTVTFYKNVNNLLNESELRSFFWFIAYNIWKTLTTILKYIKKQCRVRRRSAVWLD